jgi:hypothetical protein
VATADLAAFDFAGPSPSVQALASTTSNGQAASGPEKLVQRFAILLMTRKGSIPYAPSRGCSFVDLLLTRVNTEHDLFAAFAAATSDLRRQLRASEFNDDPADERFAKATLNQATILGGGRVRLALTVKTLAGGTTNRKLELDFLLR